MKSVCLFTQPETLESWPLWRSNDQQAGVDWSSMTHLSQLLVLPWLTSHFITRISCKWAKWTQTLVFPGELRVEVTPVNFQTEAWRALPWFCHPSLSLYYKKRPGKIASWYGTHTEKTQSKPEVYTLAVGSLWNQGCLLPNHHLVKADWTDEGFLSLTECF